LRVTVIFRPIRRMPRPEKRAIDITPWRDT
jgi:hypothetical protein